MDWTSWMKIGNLIGCHQRSDRSFFIGMYQFPLCARCTGVCVGYLAAAISFVRWSTPTMFCLACCLVMFADWYIQYLGILTSTHLRRWITGVIGGFGVLTLELKAVVFIVAGILDLLR